MKAKHLLARVMLASLGASWLGLVPAHAQDNASPAQLQVKTENGVAYLCGGVGSDESGYMKRQARDYDLMLTFAARDGSYLADVGVEIKDADGGTVFQTRCDGPILLVDLPRSGTYRIHAEANDYRVDRTAKVTAKRQSGSHLAAVVMTWPQQLAKSGGSPEHSSGSSGR